MKLSYYPGCSLTTTAKEYDNSVREVMQLLDIKLIELTDWNCCGASSAHMTNKRLAIELAARNLLIANTIGLDLLVPCSSCYQRLITADQVLREDPIKWNLNEYKPSFEIIHISNLFERIDFSKRISTFITRPLTELTVACYYGCLSTRPPKITGVTEYEQPVNMEKQLEAIGVKAVSWSHKTECCSGCLTMSRPDITTKLVSDIVSAANLAGANAIVTDCPMCQANLEARQLHYQEQEENSLLPVFYLTELIAFAADSSRDLRRFKKHLLKPGNIFTKEKAQVESTKVNNA